VSLDEQKQNFMTLLWKQADEVGPKIFPPKKRLPNLLLMHAQISSRDPKAQSLFCSLQFQED
jgi:hypothetical protein